VREARGRDGESVLRVERSGSRGVAVKAAVGLPRELWEGNENPPAGIAISATHPTGTQILIVIPGLHVIWRLNTDHLQKILRG